MQVICSSSAKPGGQKRDKAGPGSLLTLGVGFLCPAPVSALLSGRDSVLELRLKLVRRSQPSQQSLCLSPAPIPAPAAGASRAPPEPQGAGKFRPRCVWSEQRVLCLSGERDVGFGQAVPGVETRDAGGSWDTPNSSIKTRSRLASSKKSRGIFP